MSAGIPSNYAGATRLDVDANACLALSRAKWESLSKAQKSALKRAFAVAGGLSVPKQDVRAETFTVLVVEGLAQRLRRRVTGLGMMCREAGTLTRETPS